MRQLESDAGVAALLRRSADSLEQERSQVLDMLYELLGPSEEFEALRGMTPQAPTTSEPPPPEDKGYLSPDAVSATGFQPAPQRGTAPCLAGKRCPLPSLPCKLAFHLEPQIKQGVKLLRRPARSNPASGTGPQP